MAFHTSTELMCPHCRTPIAPGAEMVFCRTCHTAYHRACWEQQGGCINPACRNTLDRQNDQAATSSPDTHKLPAESPAPRENRILSLAVSVAIPVLVLLLSILAIHPGTSIGRWILVIVIVTALGFDFVNGMNDSANAIATVVSTRVLTPIAALIMASVLNLVGALLHTGVAKFIAGDVFTATQITIPMILCGLIGAVLWSWLMTAYGMPISLSHALIGGLVGASLVGGAHVQAAGITKIIIWMIVAPVIGFVAGLVLMFVLMWAFQQVAPYKVNRQFRGWQMLSSAFMAFSHGGNDAQKAMGVITLALFTAGVQSNLDVPLVVKLACASVIALGTGLGGWRVIRTLGHKMIKLAPIHGFAAETAAAGAIQVATALGAPVSTTHVISASIMGVGSSKRLSAVRWGVASNILCAWVFTIPTCGLVAALLYAIVRALGMH